MIFKLQDAEYLLQTCPVKPSLIFMDPPFNIGEPYAACSDNVDPQTYVMRLRRWIEAATRLMPSHGSLWLHLPDRWAANAVVSARDVYGLKLENWIIWHYRFGNCRSDRFINSKCHGLWFSKGNPIVNVGEAKVPSDRATIYGDSRSAGFRMDLDVWGFDKYWGRVQGNNAERRPLHPNQLPEAYLERIIRVCTNVGDTIVDPFCGSGTTAVVGSALGRRIITGDICQEYLDSAKERCKKGLTR